MVLLSAYPQGLTYEQFAELLWPRDAAAKIATGTPRQTLSKVRSWMGTNPDTDEHYLPVARSLEHRASTGSKGSSAMRI